MLFLCPFTFWKRNNKIRRLGNFWVQMDRNFSENRRVPTWGSVFEKHSYCNTSFLQFHTVKSSALRWPHCVFVKHPQFLLPPPALSLSHINLGGVSLCPLRSWLVLYPSHPGGFDVFMDIRSSSLKPFSFMFLTSSYFSFRITCSF